MISAKEIGIGKKHFMISYNKVRGVYSLKDLGQGYGTFVQISQPLCISSNPCTVLFGSIQCSVQVQDKYINNVLYLFILLGSYIQNF